MVGCLDAKPQPANPCFLKKLKVGGAYGVNARVGPRPDFELAVQNPLQQGFVIALVEEKHFIRNPNGFDAHRAEFFKFLENKIRGPIAHVCGVSRNGSLGIIGAIDDIDHAEVALEPAP